MHRPCRKNAIGVTLVELMVAMVLGLIIVGAVLNVFVSSRQTFRVNENLGQLQENARIGFELLARDIREAGSTPCGIFPSQVANVIRVGGAVPWWASWWAEGAPLRGFEGSESAANTDEIALPASIVAIGTGTNQRITGTDSLWAIQAAETPTAATAHTPADRQFTLNSITGFDEADVVVTCDLRGAAIFQIGAVSTGTKVIDYNTTLASNNCTNNLGAPINAACTTTTSRTFSPAEGIQVAKLVSNYWYVGNNSRGSRSLFRVTMINKTVAGAKTWTADTQEVIPGVRDMQIQYLTADTSASNALATDWVNGNNDTVFPFPPSGTTQVRRWDETNNANQVVAVKIQLTLQTEESISTSNAPVTRTLHFVVGVRSRSHIFS
ncbi:PilW family protein [Curvibacter sp. APW13]|uniref:PilW family protein n=1 Tax=Curvibacter sp. APW13 TaxID=3077236 RepID=UPI0028E09321|nr:PilW family protein [Curvibacter sp. APW13]MDT8991412.1 PilW family protein [Curvibacter sp. APW13]